MNLPRTRTIITVACLVLFTFGTFAQDSTSPRDLKEQALEILDTANETYARQMYKLAAEGYEKFFAHQASVILDERRDEAYYRYGECLIKLNRPKDAVKPFATIVNEFKRSRFYENALFRLATLRLVVMGDTNSAIEHLIELKERLEEPDPKRKQPSPLLLPTKYYLGRAYLQSKNYDKARPLLAAVVRERDFEFHEDALFYLAELDFTRQDWEQVIKDYLDFRKTYPNSKQALPLVNLRLGVAYRALGRYDEAIAALRLVPPDHPYSDTALHRIITCCYEKKAWAEVLKNFEQLEKKHAKPDDPYRRKKDYASALYMVGISRFNLGRYKEAVAFLERLVKSFKPPPDEETVLWKIALSYYYLRDFEGTKRSALSFLAKYGDSKKASDVNYVLADAYFGLKSFPDALAYYEKVPAESKFHSEASYRIALCHEAIAKTATNPDAKTASLRKAARAFDRFALLYKDEKRSLVATLHSADLFLQIEDYESAEKLYQRFLLAAQGKNVKPQELEHARFSIGYAQLQQKRFGAMVVSFSDLLKAFPNTKHAPYCHFWMGWHFENIKEWDKAIAHYNKVAPLKQHPLSDPAIRNLSKCYYKAKKYDDAARTFLAIMKERPRISLPDDIVIWTADHFAEKKKLETTIWVYQHLLRTNPQTSWKERCIFKLHYHYYQLGNWKKAAEFGDEFVTIFKKRSESERDLVGLGDILFRTANSYHMLGTAQRDDAARRTYMERAEARYLEVQNMGALPELKKKNEYWLGRLYFDMAKYKDALDYLIRVGLLTGNPEANYWMGRCWIEMAKKSDVEGGIEYLENVVKIWEGTKKRGGLLREAPSHPVIKEVKKLLPEVHLKLGRCYHQAGDDSKAALHLDKAASLPGEHVLEARYWAGIVHIKLAEAAQPPGAKKQHLEKVLRFWEGASGQKSLLQAKLPAQMLEEVKKRLPEVRKALKRLP